MSDIAPVHRPKLSETAVNTVVQELLDKQPDTLVLLGVRGYYEDEMGAAGKNDRGMYDDAIFVVTKSGSVTPFNANCDPSAYRRGIATLKPGIWLYKRGIHGLSRPASRQYSALVQAGEVTVTRDGKTTPESGYFGINIHRGGDESTSSLGCQTIPPDQWNEFKQLVYANAANTIPYILTTQDRVEAILKAPAKDNLIVGQNVNWDETAEFDGAVFVPVRRFLAHMLPSAVVDFNTVVTVNGFPLDSVHMRGPEAWAPIRAIAFRVGWTVSVQGTKPRVITLSK